MNITFDEIKKTVETYCKNNNLNFDKLCKLVKSWGKNIFTFLYHDPNKGKNGLYDETPMPLVLSVERVDGKLVIEQTEHTKKYIGL